MASIETPSITATAGTAPDAVHAVSTIKPPDPASPADLTVKPALPPAPPAPPAPANPFHDRIARMLQLDGLKQPCSFGQRPPPVQPPAKPRVGQHDLLIEGGVKIIGHDGLVIDIPIQLTLYTVLSPGFIPMAQEQLETSLDRYLFKPVTIAFTTHTENIQATRKAEAQKAKAIARAEQQEDEMPSLQKILDEQRQPTQSN